jgi:pimeloyl-ACP methyl ester carboxylesterase/DNA-binding CsgD family transcriptional regulator
MDQSVSFTVSKDGTSIAYAVSGKGPPIIMLCPWMTHIQYDWDSPVWSHWFRFLSERFTLIRPDMRGCGLSQQDIDSMTFTNLVEDLEAVIDALELSSFTILGMSQGAAVSVAYSLRHPEYIKYQILYAPLLRGFHHVSSSHAEQWRHIEQLIQKDWGDKNLGFPSLFAHMFIPEAKPEYIQRYAEIQRKSASKEVAAMMINIAAELNVWSDLPEVTVPTLVVQIARDQTIPPGRVREAAMLIPKSQFLSIDSSNHILLGEEPGWEQFKTLFLQHVPVSGPGNQETSTEKLPDICDLSKREQEILSQITKGLSNKEISNNLFISEKTVRNHITSIFSKLDLHSRSQAIVLGNKLGL